MTPHIDHLYFNKTNYIHVTVHVHQPQDSVIKSRLFKFFSMMTGAEVSEIEYSEASGFTVITKQENIIHRYFYTLTSDVTKYVFSELLNDVKFEVSLGK